MSLQINLEDYFGQGARASIRDDVDGSNITIAEYRFRDEREVCLLAAAQLRSLAAKFEILADSYNPTSLATKQKVNAGKVS